MTQRSQATARPAPALRKTRVRVRYADTDRMGVVYYANYLVWFEVGRTEWLRETGWSYREMESEGVALPVIEARCEYRQPARYDDEVEIATRATLLTPDTGHVGMVAGARAESLCWQPMADWLDARFS